MIIRGATVVTPAGPQIADLAIDGEVIAAVGPELPGDGAEELDAAGLVALPGVVDAHVHLNDPGRAHWEGFASGTRALAAGGTTCAIDMPLNSLPPTTDGAAFDAKRDAARGVLHVDIALWGGLVGGDIDRLDELADRGVVGFKAFMSASGVPEFPAADEVVLYEGMTRAARLGLPVAVHAESDALTAVLSARAVREGRTTMRDYLDSRPVAAELVAVAQAIALAEATGCALHVVHVSTGRAVALVGQARARGVDVTCETCPHYLVFDDRDAEVLGAPAKCAPPLRAAADQDDLWERLTAGEVDLLASDHSPAPAELKRSADAFAVWGGISGAQTLLASVWDAAVARRALSPGALGRLLGAAPATRFGLGARKGRLAPGTDADVVLIDPGGEWTVGQADLRDRHRLSPLRGRCLRGRVVRTLLRGRTVAAAGRPVGPAGGRVLCRDGVAV